MTSVATSLIVPALAQDTLKITVTGTRSERPAETFPGSIEVMESDEINSKNTADTIDILDDFTGVSFENIYSSKTGYKGNYNAGNINIRGVDGNRILMMIDGVRLPESYIYGDYYKLGRAKYINFDTIKAVEVFKGPASSLYGSDALGGLVYFRSLEPGDFLDDDKDNSINVPFSYDSSNDGFKESIKIASNLSDKLSSLFIFTREDSSEYKVKTDSKYLDDFTNEGNNFFANLEYKINDNSKVNLIGDFVKRDVNSTMADGNLDVLSYTSHSTNSKTESSRLNLVYNYNNEEDSNFLDKAKVSIFSQYQRIDDNYDRNYLAYNFMTRSYSPANKDQDYYLKNTSYGADIQLNSTVNAANKDHKLTYGIDYSSFDTLRLQTTIDNSNPSDPSTEVAKYNPDTVTQRLGIYIQDEFSSGNFDFIAGVRYDSYDLDASSDAIFQASGIGEQVAADHSSNAVSPSLTATYNWSPGLSSYIKYAKGFRSPSFQNINSSRNPGYYTTKSNPDLKAERSDTYEVGLKRNTKKQNLATSVFFSKYKDFIEAYAPTGNANEFMSQNAADAEIWGVEFNSTYYLKEERYGTSFNTTLAYTKGDNLTDNEPLTTVQPFDAKFSIRYNTEDDSWLHTLTANYVGEPRVKSGTETFVPDSYFTFDFTTRYKYSDSLELTAGVYNLLDETYYNYQSVQGLDTDLENLTRYSQPGRSIKLGFNWKF